MKKNIIYNAIGSLAYAATSLFFLIIVTRINGVDDAGIFSFGFAFALLLTTIGNYATRTFQVTETKNDLVDTDFICHRIITIGLMLIIALLYSLINGYDTYKFIIILLLVIYKVLESFSEVLYAIIQKKDELYKVGISFFLKAVLGILVFILTNIIFENLIFSIIALILITLVITIVYDFNIIKKYHIEKKKFDIKKMKLIFIIGFNTFLFSFLTIYVMNAPRYAIDSILTEYDQTIFGIILMPATVLALVGNFLIHPFLNKLKEKLHKKEKKAFINIVIKMILFIIVIGLLSIIAAYAVGIPVLELIYGLNLSEYRLELILILSGAVFYAITFILSAALITMRKTLSQSIIFIIVSIMTLVMSQIMVTSFGIFGATITYVSTMFVLLVLYIGVFRYSTRKKFA